MHPSSGVLKTVSATTGVRHAVKYRLKLLIFLLTVDSYVLFCVFLFTSVHVSNVVTIYALKFVQ